MAIVHCRIPDLPLALLARAGPLPPLLAVHDAGERILAATAPARQAGVAGGQSIRQARLLCPELALQAADLPAAASLFEALLALLDDYSNAVEPAGLGHAYMDAPGLDAATAPAFCADLGRRLRREFGPALQPAIGCDQGKFTACAAACWTRPGRIRVVLGEAEQPFLRPLPVRLLPLPAAHLELLHLLGIRTLGQFGGLPPRAVFQQFGRPGRLAQAWAQGRDARPVTPRQQRPTLTLSAEFDPPLAALPPLLAVAGRLLAPALRKLRDRLQALQALRAVVQFAGGQEQEHIWRLAAATSDERRLLPLLAERWQAQPWPEAVTGLALTLSEIQETPADQLALFPMPAADLDDAAQVAGLVGQLYGDIHVAFGPGRFLQAEVLDPLRLRVERRAIWREFGL